EGLRSGEKDNLVTARSPEVADHSVGDRSDASASRATARSPAGDHHHPAGDKSGESGDQVTARCPEVVPRGRSGAWDTRATARYPAVDHPQTAEDRSGGSG